MAASSRPISKLSDPDDRAACWSNNRIAAPILRLFSATGRGALLCLLTGLSCNLAERLHLSEPEDSSHVMWRGYYAVTRIGESELEAFLEEFDVARDEVRIVQYRDGRQYLRVPARLRDELSSRGRFLDENPPFRFVDPDIEVRRAAQDVRTWLSGFVDGPLTEQILRRFAADFPEYARLEKIGESARGRPIYALRISASPHASGERPAVLFLAAHHGNEPLAINYALDAAYTLLYGCDPFVPEDECANLLRRKTSAAGVVSYRSGAVQSYLDEFDIWIAPMINPDGVDVFWNQNLWAGRKNGRDTTEPPGWNIADGVDLNRNYPFHWNTGAERASSGDPGSIFYRGPTPASEPETRAVMSLAERIRPSLVLSFHCFATRVLVPYTVDRAINPTPNPAWRVGRELAAAGISHRPVKRYAAVRNIYPVDGTDQDWLYFKLGALAYIVEGSYLHAPFEPYGRLSVQGMRGISLRAFEVFRDGPTLAIEATDPAGRPLRAHVRLPGAYFFEDERYETHPLSGRFYYALDEGGPVQVRLEKEGYAPEERIVNCYRGVCPASFLLTPLAAQ